MIEENISLEIVKDCDKFADELIDNFEHDVNELIMNTFHKPNMREMKELGFKFNAEKITLHGYHRFYDFFLRHLRLQPITMLEIGISRGKSLNMWMKYFPKSFIYGIDIKKEGINERYQIFKGDQGNMKFMDEVITTMKSQNKSELDLIVDDGSHLCSHQVECFNKLFPLIKKEGIYIIEDIETSYWTTGSCYAYMNKKEYGHGYLHPKSCIEIFKQVADAINKAFLIKANKKEMYKKLNAHGISTDVINTIQMITFAYNCIIIHKKGNEDVLYDDKEYVFAKYL